ncbi:DUF2933 domain-containing protein [Mameliella sp. MMSF_3455]|uniref:DUF2933 domain-containing protein n=1 Tax=Mameliella sp. MMSF_3455 TaxID=3046714 RepID=UPI00273D3E35|nr:DUF2933 domain-containing protein [Mameliella sp. MMSF_3455]
MKDDGHSGKGAGKLMHWGMMACCAVMLLPIAGYFIGGGTLSGLGSNALTFAPLMLCVGAHLVMHKMMGKSCHGHDTAKSEARQESRPEEA